MESISLLIAPYYLKRSLKVDRVFIVYLLTTILLLLSIFSWDLFPNCFIEGKGLTPFKITSEYIISSILGASMIVLWVNRRALDPKVFQLVIWSIVTTIISELAFTFYISVYGLSNLVGHYFKIISFYFIYKAIIETGLTKPYDLLFRNLKLSKEEVQRERDFAESLVNTAQVITLLLDPQGRIIRFNPYMEEISGYSIDEARGKDWFDTFLPEKDRGMIRELFSKAIDNIQTRGNINPILTKTGEERLIEWNDKTLKDAEGKTVGLLAIGQDITQRKQTEEDRERLIKDLQKALLEVKTLSGFLPICMSCKKIRDDKGYWEQVEVYIRDHSEAEFSHGICPDCLKKLYPDEI
jgi:PAS domain S-box-containing protein